jgi:hypothetical protein
MEPTCIYCGRSGDVEFTQEHVIPRALGKFLLEDKELVLRDRVCGDCNNALGDCDAELAYAGPEAIYRLRAGIKGRPRPRKSSPFYKNRTSQPPIDLVGQRPDRDRPDFWQIDPSSGLATELRAITFDHPGTRSRAAVRLTEGMTGDGLRRTLEGAGCPGIGHAAEVSCSDNDQDWVADLCRAAGLRIDWVQQRAAHDGQQVRLQAHPTMTDRHHRAVAKIALNYVLYFALRGLSGHEDALHAVREFIRFGRGSPEDFVLRTPRPAIEGVGSGRALKDCGHVVTGLVGPEVTAQVQLFTGRDFPQGTYQVRLGRYPSRVITPPAGRGHFFRITSSPEDEHDAGEVIELQSIVSIAPVPFRFHPRPRRAR